MGNEMRKQIARLARLRLTSAALTGVFFFSLVACSAQPRTLELPERRARTARAAKGADLFLHYPLFDQRIVQLSVSATSVKRQRVIFPSRHEPDLRAVRDFAVDKRNLYLLFSTRHRSYDRRLFVVPLDKTSARQAKIVMLPPNPQLLSWAKGGKLLVGHGHSSGRDKDEKDDAPRAPKAGLLTVIDSKKLAIEATYALDGAVIALTAADDDHVYLVGRQARQMGNSELHRDALYQIALSERSIVAKLPLPSGARTVAIGPRGLLHVPLSSGTGLHATDATTVVIDPKDLTVLYRQRPKMVVRSLQSWNNQLIEHLLRYNGDAWIQIYDRNHQSGLDYRMGQLPTGQLAVVDGIAYLPLRGKHELERVDVEQGKRLPRLVVPGVPKWDKSGLLRTRMVFGQHRDAASKRASK
jgi:hypothetical protein